MPQTPERKKIQQREYCARPEVKAKRAASHATWMEKNKDKKQAAEARRRLERRAYCLHPHLTMNITRIISLAGGAVPFISIKCPPDPRSLRLHPGAAAWASGGPLAERPK